MLHVSVTRLYEVLHMYNTQHIVTVDIFRLPVPTLVTYNKTSYKSDDEILHETDIGPEVTHIYQVFII